ncbi:MULTISPECIES: D-2-hydroxyacid dehydrogenase [Halobacterium]|uniref:D-2-hydroxyacid dehydrogenase n=1 Tax=Halobacterium TaxID=2239 RepID=UPI00073E6CC6|nr:MULTISPECIES: D-2-hydroxyacid dehydrogenase [Halobacterium]MCG1004771.1 D-2-hydroxyacid dehydrogenase [Halobacterium noricense]
MSDTEPLERLCVHESIDEKVPIGSFVDALNHLPVPVEVIDDDAELEETDAVASYRPRECFLAAGWVHCLRAGYDEFDTDAYESSGTPLTNSTGIHATTVGELVAGYMLMFARRMHVYRDQQNQRQWYDPPYDQPFTVAGETVCVVGLGTIGRGVAEYADGIGMDVIGVRRSDEAVRHVSTIYSPADLHEAIGEARFVVAAVPKTPETEGLFSTAEFRQMRTDAYLINVARGPVVDQNALVGALENDAIAGAGLDVFDTEPLPETSPLWDFEEVIISPHEGSSTNRYHHDLADLVVEIFDQYQSGVPLRNRVA